MADHGIPRLDPALGYPHARYAALGAESSDGGILEAGRILYQADGIFPITFLEARVSMGYTGKKVGPLTILYQVFGRKFNPFDKSDTDRIERAIHKLQREHAGDLWQRAALVPRINFPPADVGSKAQYAMAPFSDIALFKQLRKTDLHNGTQKFRATFAGLATSPRVFVLWVHIDPDADPAAISLQLRAHLHTKCDIHAMWAVDRGNVNAGHRLEFTGIVMALLTLHGDPERPPSFEEWSIIPGWVQVGDRAYPTFYRNRPPHCTTAACRTATTEFHLEDHCPNLRCIRSADSELMLVGVKETK